MRRKQLAEVSKYAWPWLRAVGDKVKEKGLFPLTLADMYQNNEDREVAVFLDLLIPWSATRTQYVIELRNIIGSTPSEMIRRRLFASIFSPEDNTKILNNPFLTHSVISQIMDWIWDKKYRQLKSMEYVATREYQGDIGLSESVKAFLPIQCDTGSRLAFLIAKMSLADGFGIGVWDKISPEYLPLPLTKDIVLLLRKFYKLESFTKSNVGEILQYMGWERPIEFIYTSWGIERMRHTMADDLITFLNTFEKHLKIDKMLRYCSGTDYYDCKLKNEIPNIII